MLALLQSALLIPAAALLALAPLAAAPVHVASLPEGAIVPDAGVDDAGIIHVAYLSGTDVHYVRSADEGVSFSEPIRINTEPGFAFGAAFRGPDLAVGQKGRVHVVWYNAGYQQKRPQSEWGVMYARLDPVGMKFEPSRNLNGRPSDNFSLAADRSGKVAVIWTAGGAFATLSENGGDTFAPPRKLELDPCECCGTRALYSDEGSLLVLYRDKTDNLRDTNLARLPRDGKKWTNEQVSRTPWPIDSCPMTGSFLSSGKEGVFAAWETRNQPYFAALRPGPKNRKPTETRVSEKGRYPVVLASTQRTLVAWKDGTTLGWRFFDPEGAPLGKPESSKSASPHRPAGVVTKSGTFVLFP